VPSPPGQQICFLASQAFLSGLFCVTIIIVPVLADVKFGMKPLVDAVLARRDTILNLLFTHSLISVW
jgi:hypothetical protein